jgi:hypothetical protein
VSSATVTDTTTLSKKAPNWLPKAVLVVVLCIAIPIIYLSFRFAMADISAYSVKYAIESWDQKGELIPLDKIDPIAEKVDSAIGWWPDNAEYIEMKARVELYRAITLANGEKDVDAAMTHLNSAIDLHNKAIELRPHWPYSWANRTLVKAYTGVFDAEYFEGFAKASQFGPWEISSNLSLVEAGLIGWAKLDDATLKLVVAAAERVAEHKPGRLAALLDRYQFKAPFCELMTESDQQKKACK